MKKLIIIAITMVFASCSDNLEDLNKNIKDPAAVSGESLFTGAQKALVDQIVNIDVNENNTRLWSQFLQETTYTDESNYDQVTRTIPENLWSAIYRDALKDLDEAGKVIEATTYTTAELEALKPNKLQIIEILKVYAFSHLIETFGNVPYDEALNIDILTPAYDDGMTVYKELISRLTAASNALDPSEGSFLSGENIYNGDVSSWIKFANSLKLRMGIVLADADETFSKATVKDAVTAGVFTNSDDNANMHYLSAAPNTHPVHKEVVLSGRNDFVAAETLTDILNALNDPRRALWLNTVDGAYVGGEIGTPSAYASHSSLSDQVVVATAPGVIMSYSEVRFLLAEATARGGYDVAGTPAAHYTAAITASIDEWGGSSADATAYIAQPSVDYATQIATKTWREVIGTQRWISLFNRGVEAWLSIRLMDYPIMAEPSEALSGFPNRYTYPIVEQTINSANYAAASAAIGEDTAEQKLFFDKY